MVTAVNFKTSNLNNRKNFSQFFDIKSDKVNKGIVEAGTIIDGIKKITNLKNIKKLEKAKRGKNKLKKTGFENLFNPTISELSEREGLVEKGKILFERYFNEIFSVFKNDKPKKKNEPKTSFLLSKFWGGWVNLLIIFLEEGLDWNSIRDELNKIRDNVIKLREIDEYTTPLFQSNDPKIPDSSSSPKRTGDFLNQNRKKPVSIQDIN